MNWTLKYDIKVLQQKKEAARMEKKLKELGARKTVRLKCYILQAFFRFLLKKKDILVVNVFYWYKWYSIYEKKMLWALLDINKYVKDVHVLNRVLLLFGSVFSLPSYLYFASNPFHRPLILVTRFCVIEWVINHNRNMTMS